MLMKLIMLGIWMVVIPLGMGMFAMDLMGRKKKAVVGGDNTVSFAFGSGYILMWAIFQLMAVPFILKEAAFPYLEFAFEITCLPIALAGFVFLGLHVIKPGIAIWKRNGGKRPGILKPGKENLPSIILWGLFLASLLFQMLQAYRLAYADGDDAFYISLSTSTNLNEGMYRVIPYTGSTTELDFRHGLAPFPMWVSFIAAKCSVNAAVAAHSLMPLVLIPLTYVIYLETGRLLCRGKKKFLPVFMIFVSLLQVFGNYSIYPVSTFLLTRSRQGKSALGNVILPFLVLVLLRMADEIKEQGKAGWQNVFWLTAAMTAGCLCSTMSGFLCCMLVMLTSGLFLLVYRKPKVLWQGMVSCLSGIIYAFLYFKLK